MKDIPEEKWRAERPIGISANDAIEYCLTLLFEDKKRKAKDKIVSGIDFETIIGTLLLAQDVVTEHEECYD